VTTPAPFEFDEIGDWSELKLEIVEKYGSAYTKAFPSQKGKALALNPRAPEADAEAAV
jgi:hypothetical protein